MEGFKNLVSYPLNPKRAVHIWAREVCKHYKIAPFCSLCMLINYKLEVQLVKFRIEVVILFKIGVPKYIISHYNAKHTDKELQLNESFLRKEWKELDSK